MRRKLFSLVLLIMDVVIVVVSDYLALFIRLEGNSHSVYYSNLLLYLPLAIGIQLAFFYLFGLYRRLWQYASIGELIGITASVTAGSLFICLVTLSSHLPFPKSCYIIAWFLNILLIGISRFCLRIGAQLKRNPAQEQSRVLIVGAGSAGALIAREMQRNPQLAKKLVGFIDDAPSKRGKMLLGLKVLGNCPELKQMVIRHRVDEIIVAVPSLPGQQLRTLISRCRETGCKVKIVPGLDELICGKPALEQLRDVNLEDLLRRKPVQLDLHKLAGYLKGKRVLVTGAGGSIGSELCRQIIRFQPECLYLLGRGENSIYEIEQELRGLCPKVLLEPVIADVRDVNRIQTFFSQKRPAVIFHAAAHKHVPLMELQPEEAVQNNVFGTKNVAETAHLFGAELFVMISTDKAVNPSSVMGTTKRVAEQVIQSLNAVSKTKFVAVRFGNVLGSRGSVVPLFKKQIAAGGPVTVTHPEMKRYFMTIPEAVQLVLQAGAMARGGEVFVLDMGEPVKIYDMACTLIELAGLRPEKDIEVKFTGLRPGEKLFEELLTAEEGTKVTNHKKIYIANLQAVDRRGLERGLALLQKNRLGTEIRKLLADLVPTYSGYKPGEVAAGEKPYGSEPFYSAEAAAGGIKQD